LNEIEKGKISQDWQDHSLAKARGFYDHMVSLKLIII
jgi:hypothetical protein